MMRKVIIFGIDGADWNLINSSIKSGSLMVFNEVIQNGFSGALISTIPPFSLPAWTSIFTGTNPGKHGITDIIIREKRVFKIATSNYRMVEPIWCYLSYKGLKSIIVNEPTTFPPEIINGIMISGMMTPSRSSNFAFPSTIISELKRVTEGYWYEVPNEYYKLIGKDRGKAFNLLNQFATKTFKAGMYLAQNYEWNLLVMILTSTDRLQHFYFNYPEYVKKHYQFIDKMLNDLLNLAISEDAQLIIVSDHGFKPIKYHFNVNALLKRLGFQKRKLPRDLFGRVNPRFRSQFKDLFSKIGLLTKRYLNENREDAAFAKTASGIHFSNMLDDIKKRILTKILINNLSKVKGPDGKSPIKEVFKREEITWGSYVNRAPEIILLCNEGYEASSDPFTLEIFELPFYKRVRLTGGHRPKGIFLAYGSSIRKHCATKEYIFAWDVAPILLHMLGLAIPDYMDGRVLKEIFKEGSEPAIRSIKYKYRTEQERIRLRLKALSKRRII